jgi:hypothetical protein
MPYQQQLSYQVCPIILTGGTAAQVPGGMLPMLSLFATGETTSLGLPFDIGDLDSAFGAFNVLPGGTLVIQEVAKYPFANQWVAANAVIRQPITVSVIMDSPMRPPSNQPFLNVWEYKQTVFTALKATLDSHNNVGGTYTVATPAFIYDNMVMISLTDNSRGNNSLPQNAWRFDFERPLIVLSELQEAQNLQMQKITNGLQTQGLLAGPLPGQTSGQANQARTIKAAGGLTMGIPVPNTNPIAVSRMFNYPALPNPSNFPFRGIS